MFGNFQSLKPNPDEHRIQPIEASHLGATVRPWRLAALLATKDGAFFNELANDPEKAKAFAPTASVLRGFAERMRMVAKLAECAAARVLVAGCNHEQFSTWATEEA